MEGAMTVNEHLLKKARAAGDRLAEAEQQVQLARAEYHAMVRRMHLAGASLRELAQVLGLSHQRIQQMVGGAGGSWWQKVWRTRNLKGNLSCTFCGRPQDEVARLIAGPKVFICDACVERAERSLAGAPAGHAAGSPLARAAQDAKARCSFCRKRRGADRQLLTARDANICEDCLGVCRQIISDSTP
jgi:hypothetical protein